MEIRFDAGTHEYRVDGVVVPSVTQALSPISPWDGKPAGYHADRGTRVHLGTELYDQRNLMDFQKFLELNPDTQGYIRAYLDFLAEFSPKWEAIEWIGAHPNLRYAGTVDRIGAVNGGNYVVDIKTGKANPLYGVQLAAYHRLATDTGGQFGYLGGRAVLQLSSNGSFRFIPLPPEELESDWGVFRSCLVVYNWRRAHGIGGN